MRTVGCLWCRRYRRGDTGSREGAEPVGEAVYELGKAVEAFGIGVDDATTISSSHREMAAGREGVRRGRSRQQRETGTDAMRPRRLMRDE